jgi:hypothetical protein
MSLKEIPKETIKDQTEIGNVFVIVHKNTKYRLNNHLIDRRISGELDPQSFEPEGANKFYQVFIYIADDYEIQGRDINVSFEHVDKVELYKVDGVKTAVFIGGAVLIVIGLIYALFSSDMEMNSGLNSWY